MRRRGAFVSLYTPIWYKMPQIRFPWFLKAWLKWRLLCEPLRAQTWWLRWLALEIPVCADDSRNFTHTDTHTRMSVRAHPPPLSVAGGNLAALIKHSSESHKTVRPSVAPWKQRDANICHSHECVCVGGWNSSKILEERSLWSCNGKCHLQGTQETATHPEAERRNCRTKSWSDRKSVV